VREPGENRQKDRHTKRSERERAKESERQTEQVRKKISVEAFLIGQN